MAHIFLTGATGFLGSYILRQLVTRGHSVTALRRESSRTALIHDIEDKVTWLYGDVLEIEDHKEALVGIDAIIHAAAVISFDKRDKEKMFDINVDSTRDLVNLALGIGIKKLVYISSIAALGRYRDSKMVDENIEWEDSPEHTMYGISKQMGEREVWRGFAEGIDTVVLNPSLILGAGYWGENTARIITQLYKGVPFYPTGSTGMVDVRDVAILAVAALESDITGKRYIISSENKTFKEYFENVCRVMGKKGPSRPMTKFWRGIAWRGSAFLSLISGKERMITKSHMVASARHTAYDNTLSKATFDHNYIPIAETWEATAKCYLASRESGLEHGILDFE